MNLQKSFKFFDLRSILILFSVLLFALSFLGPEGIPIKSLIFNIDIHGLYKIFSQETESIFRTPNTILRLSFFTISLLFLVMTGFIENNEKLIYTKRQNSFYIALISLFMITYLTTSSLYNLVYISILIISILYYLKTKYIVYSLFEKQFILLSIILFYYSIYSASINNANIRELDIYFRFLFAIPLFFFIRSLKFDIFLFILVINTTSILIGIFALYFYIVIDQPRVYGFSSTATTYANISFLFGIFSFICFLYLKKHNKNIIFCIISIIFALIAWSLTNTRSNIFSIPLILLILLLPSIKQILKVNIKDILIFSVFFFILIFQSNIYQRMNDGFTELSEIVIDSSYETSWKDTGAIKPRLIIWQASWNMIKEYPVKGVGFDKFNQNLENQISLKMIPKIRINANNHSGGFNHAHNQYLDTFAKTGIFGLLILLAYLLCYFTFFIKSLSVSSDKKSFFAILGLVTIVLYSFNMLTHSVFSHHQATLFFIFILATLSAIISSMYIKSENL